MESETEMRDYIYHAKDGSITPIALLPTKQIHEALEEGFDIVDHSLANVEGVKERLLLEIFIRENNLR